jgi:hypothetical protein
MGGGLSCADTHEVCADSRTIAPTHSLCCPPGASALVIQAGQTLPPTVAFRQLLRSHATLLR